MIFLIPTRVQFHIENELAQISIGFKGFHAMFDITAQHLHTIKTVLAKAGLPSIDNGHKDRKTSNTPKYLSCIRYIIFITERAKNYTTKI